MKVITLALILLLCSSVTARTVSTDPDFTRFWLKFKSAIARNDKAAVADMTKLPFTVGSQDLNREAFIKKYNWLFNARVRRCLARGKPGKDGEIYEVFCGEEIYVFAKVNGVYKFTEIGVND